MKPSVTVAFDPDIRPIIRDGGQFVCRACCELMHMEVNEIGYCITTCPHHPSIMIQGNKVVGTSA